MHPTTSKRIASTFLACVSAACARTVAVPADRATSDPADGSLPSAPPASAPPPPAPPASAPADAPRREDGSPSRVAQIGQIALAPDRPIFYAQPRAQDGAAATLPGPKPWRLVGHLHGICYPPSYSCGKWVGAAVERGVLVCPTGNARCGDASTGPPSWEAASWEDLVAAMDADLERSVAKVEAKHPGSIRRDGAILTGFSRGAYAAPMIARMHPGRWPYLVLIEANVPLSVASLTKAGVRAVALVAGERGTEIAGERKTEGELLAAGFPARLFVMKNVAHLYSDDMERVMSDALGFVLEHAPEHLKEDGGGL